MAESETLRTIASVSFCLNTSHLAHGCLSDYGSDFQKGSHFRERIQIRTLEGETIQLLVLPIYDLKNYSVH